MEPFWVLFGVPRSPALTYFCKLLIPRAGDTKARGMCMRNPLGRAVVRIRWGLSFKHGYITSIADGNCEGSTQLSANESQV